MNFFKKKGTLIWFVVSVVLIVLMVAVTVVGSYYSRIITIFLDAERVEKPKNAEDAVVFYEKETASKQEANQKSADVTRRIAEEGFILLKNDNALPLQKGAKVSVFGKNSVNLVYGGSGSGGGDTTFTKNTLYESLEAAGFEYNPTLKAFYEDNNKSGSERQENPSDLDSGNTVAISTGETPYANYTANGIPASYAQYSDAALVVFSRVGGEGFDLPMGAANGAKHYLDLDTNEKDLLSNVCNAGFKHVIVILNTLNIMEADFINNYGGKIDGCLWIGGPGQTGIMALGDILNGTVTPSGHTTDTWAKDFTKDPTWNNFSDRNTSNGDRYYNTETGKNVLYYYANYEESVYVGYRYYETRAYDERLKNGNDDWYKQNVLFPFGYGLSYTSFDIEVADDTSISGVEIKADGSYEVTVKVTNTGAYKGKEVVQLYATLPYTPGGVEKPYEVLCGFEKTPLLYPTADKAVNPDDAASNDKPNSCEVQISFTPYDIASYDYKGKSGFKGYVLEAGNYQLLVNSDSHTNLASIPFEVKDNITYRNDPETGNEVVNRYTDCENEAFNSDTMIKDSLLTRADWEGSMPDAFKSEDRNVTTAFINQIRDKSHNNPNADTYTMPTQGAAVKYDLAALAVYDDKTEKYFAEYDGDELQQQKWEAVLNALSVKDMLELYNNGAFQTIGFESSINKPKTLESDGPVGWCNFIAKGDTWKNNTAYTSQVVMSATWNTELIEEMGKCVGEEALWGSPDGRSYSGWYSPGVNIHRSPFGGRNFEYFSEDSFLTGKIAAAEINGCQAKGVYCYVKHFALNEQETHRNGSCSWVTEQAMREIYLKPFEIVVKDSGTRALMSSFNRIGTRWTGGDYRLLTEILRNEWGFRGTVISDYNQSNDYMDNKQMLYAGGDLNLCSDQGYMWTNADENSAADVTVLRMATKNILYTVVNSNAMNGLGYIYLMPYWQIALIVVDCLVAVGIAVWGFFAVRKALKKDEQVVQTERSE